jgi:hypothetical protein
MNARAKLVSAFQRFALVLSYHWYRLRGVRSLRAVSWVVGPEECASMVLQIAGAIPGSFSVSFTTETAYEGHYDFQPRRPMGAPGGWLERVVAGPVLLGRLMNQAVGFIYVGASGFLESTDYREFEFAYLRKKGIPIVCYWCGSDIRSTRRMHELERATGMPNISTYIGERGAIFETDAWEEQKRRIADVSSRHASAMFSNSVDHLSYLTMGTEPFLYFLPDRPLALPDKFDDASPIVIVHATTAPSIKGTPLVRAAIAQLREEGYEFEYVELIGVPNTRVREELDRAHIVLNQFYGFSPAVFGVEALAAGCVVLMSSDESVETDLPVGSNDCWVVTKHHQVYSHLKRLLDDPRQLEPIARRGRAWAEKHAMRASAGRTMMAVLDSVRDGTYRSPEARS